MQMTRQRQQESLSANLYTDCPYCRGRGIGEERRRRCPSSSSAASPPSRAASSCATTARSIPSAFSSDPSILERLRSEDADLLVRVEKLYGVKLAFRADPGYHLEHFKVINALTGEEYR